VPVEYIELSVGKGVNNPLQGGDRLEVAGGINEDSTVRETRGVLDDKGGTCDAAISEATSRRLLVIVLGSIREEHSNSEEGAKRRAAGSLPQERKDNILLSLCSSYSSRL